MRQAIVLLGYILGLSALGMAHVSGWYVVWGDGPRGAALFALSFAQFCISVHILTVWRDRVQTKESQ